MQNFVAFLILHVHMHEVPNNLGNTTSAIVAEWLVIVLSSGLIGPKVKL